MGLRRATSKVNGQYCRFGSFFGARKIYESPTSVAIRGKLYRVRCDVVKQNHA